MVLRNTQPHIVEAVLKSLKWLLSCVLADASARCGTDLSRDQIKMVARYEHEGLSFLTITLPSFCADFERCLDRGSVGPNDFTGFARSSSLPRFLSGLTTQVFEKMTGRLLDAPDHDAILCIRQICLMFKKVKVACSPERVKRALVRYKECEHEVSALPDFTLSSEDGLTADFSKVCGILYSGLGAAYLRKKDELSIVPKHGPGATADRVLGNSKYTLKEWHERLQEHFPLDQFALPNAGWFTPEVLEEIRFVEPAQEPPVRVIFVPKTLKTPRVIAIEPVCMQYTQQALLEFMVNELERLPLVRGHVNFRDQTINQRRAYEGSLYGHTATLDLKEASDRVSLSLVRAMLKSTPEFLDALLACRSTSAYLPDGSFLPSLGKFASMGSATCFPIEAMAFYAIVLTGMLRSLSLPITPDSVRQARRQVYVYGDDLIVPVDQVQPIIASLRAFGLETNSAKSFWTGRFRESCGHDFYAGTKVTPVYLREIVDDRRSKRGLVSLVSFANQLYENGWWVTARDVRAYVEAMVGPLPHVLSTSPGLGWTSFLGSYTVERWNRRLMRWETKAHALSPVEHDDPIHGRGALLKFFLSRRGDLPLAEEDFQMLKEGGAKPLPAKSIHKTVRRGDVHINRRWVRPF